MAASAVGLGVMLVLSACGGGSSKASSSTSAVPTSPASTASPTSSPAATTTTTTGSATGVQVLPLPADERAALRETHLALLRSSGGRADGVDGPLPGSVYYALDRGSGTYWALATFSHPDTGTTDQPEIFSKKQGGAWQDLGDSGGDPCKVPAAVLAAWSYRASC